MPTPDSEASTTEETPTLNSDNHTLDNAVTEEPPPTKSEEPCNHLTEQQISYPLHHRQLQRQQQRKSAHNMCHNSPHTSPGKSTSFTRFIFTSDLLQQQSCFAPAEANSSENDDKAMVTTVANKLSTSSTAYPTTRHPTNHHHSNHLLASSSQDCKHIATRPITAHSSESITEGIANTQDNRSNTTTRSINSAQLDWHVEILCGLFLRSDERELDWLEQQVISVDNNLEEEYCKSNSKLKVNSDDCDVGPVNQVGGNSDNYNVTGVDTGGGEAPCCDSNLDQEVEKRIHQAEKETDVSIKNNENGHASMARRSTAPFLLSESSSSSSTIENGNKVLPPTLPNSQNSFSMIENEEGPRNENKNENSNNKMESRYQTGGNKMQSPDQKKTAFVEKPDVEPAKNGKRIVFAQQQPPSNHSPFRQQESPLQQQQPLVSGLSTCQRQSIQTRPSGPSKICLHKTGSMNYHHHYSRPITRMGLPPIENSTEPSVISLIPEALRCFLSLPEPQAPLKSSAQPSLSFNHKSKKAATRTSLERNGYQNVNNSTVAGNATTNGNFGLRRKNKNATGQSSSTTMLHSVENATSDSDLLVLPSVEISNAKKTHMDTSAEGPSHRNHDSTTSGETHVSDMDQEMPPLDNTAVNDTKNSAQNVHNLYAGTNLENGDEFNRPLAIPSSWKRSNYTALSLQQLEQQLFDSITDVSKLPALSPNEPFQEGSEGQERLNADNDSHNNNSVIEHQSIKPVPMKKSQKKQHPMTEKKKHKRRKKSKKSPQATKKSPSECTDSVEPTLPTTNNYEVCTILYNECSLAALANWTMLDFPTENYSTGDNNSSNANKDSATNNNNSTAPATFTTASNKLSSSPKPPLDNHNKQESHKLQNHTPSQKCHFTYNNQEWETYKKEFEKQNAMDSTRFTWQVPHLFFRRCGICGKFGHYEVECELLLDKPLTKKKRGSEMIHHSEPHTTEIRISKRQKIIETEDAVLDKETKKKIVASLAKEIRIQRTLRSFMEDIERESDIRAAKNKRDAEVYHKTCQGETSQDESLRPKTPQSYPQVANFAADMKPSSKGSDKTLASPPIIRHQLLMRPPLEPTSSGRREKTGTDKLSSSLDSLPATAPVKLSFDNGESGSPASPLCPNSNGELTRKSGATKTNAFALPLGSSSSLPSFEEEEDEDDEQDQYIINSSSCNICGSGFRGEEMLLCDGCDELFHYKCLDPPLDGVPEGDWFCSKCISYDSDVSSAVEIEGCGDFVIEQRKRSVAEKSNEFAGVSFGQQKSQWTVALSLLNEKEPTVRDPSYMQAHLYGKMDNNEELNMVSGELCWAKRFDDQLSREDWWPAMLVDSMNKNLKNRRKSAFTVAFFALGERTDLRSSDILPFFPYYEDVGHKRLIHCDSSEHVIFRRAMELCISTLGLKSLGQALKKSRDCRQKTLDVNELRPSVFKKSKATGCTLPAGWEYSDVDEVDGMVILSKVSSQYCPSSTNFSKMHGLLDTESKPRGSNEINGKGSFAMSTDVEDNQSHEASDLNYVRRKKMMDFSLDEIIGGIVSWRLKSLGTPTNRGRSEVYYGIVVSINAGAEKALVRVIPILSEVSSGTLDSLFRESLRNGSSMPLIHANNLGPTIWMSLRSLRFVCSKASRNDVDGFQRTLESVMENEIKLHSSRFRRAAIHREENMVELGPPFSSRSSINSNATTTDSSARVTRSNTNRSIQTKTSGSAASPSASQNKSRDPAGEGLYDLEAILEERVGQSSEKEYLVKWKGFDESHNTWEPAKNIYHHEFLRAFNARKILSRLKQTPQAKNKDSLTYRLIEAIQNGLNEGHPHNANSNQSKLIACPFCDFRSAYTNAMSNHVRIHKTMDNYELIRECMKECDSRWLLSMKQPR